MRGAWAFVLATSVAACTPAGSSVADAAAADAGAITDGARVDASGEAIDAAGSDGGATVDAARVDGGGAVDAAGGERGCLPTDYLCERFETATIDSAYAQDLFAGTASIETTRAARGASALHVHVGADGGSRALLTSDRGFPVAGNSFYGRAFVYLDGAVPGGHVGIFSASGPLSGGGDAEVRLGIGNGALLPNYTAPGVEYGTWHSPPPPMPAGRWACIELAYLDDPGDDDQLHYFIDGEEQTLDGVYGGGTDHWTAPSYEAFTFGVILYHPSDVGELDVWMDDVVLAPERVGCD